MYRTATRNVLSNRFSRRHNGMALAYGIIILSALLIMASLVVDYGHVQLVKQQCRATADACATAAAGALPNGVVAAQNAALNIAAANLIDGKPATLDINTDLEFGTWNATTRTFTVLTGAARSGANAARVAMHRTAARGNAVNLVFARSFGRETCNVNAMATAIYRPTRFAAVGLDFIKMGGNSTDSYSSLGGVVSPYLGSIASNGDITLSGSATVQGDAHPGVGKVVIGASHVSGNTAPLSAPLNYPVADPGTIRTINNNGYIPTWAMKNGAFKIGNQEVVTMPAGDYYFSDFYLGAGSTVNVTGPVNIYMYGNLTLSGHPMVAGNLPKNLKIFVVKGPNGEMPGTISLASGSDLYADIHAPLSVLTSSGNGAIYGSMVAKSISMTGNSALHYDVALRGGVELVQ